MFDPLNLFGNREKMIAPRMLGMTYGRNARVLPPDCRDVRLCRLHLSRLPTRRVEAHLLSWGGATSVFCSFGRGIGW